MLVRAPSLNPDADGNLELSRLGLISAVLIRRFSLAALELFVALRIDLFNDLLLDSLFVLFISFVSFTRLSIQASSVQTHRDPFQMLQDASRCFKMLQNASKCFKTLLNAENWTDNWSRIGSKKNPSRILLDGGSLKSIPRRLKTS